MPLFSLLLLFYGCFLCHSHSSSHIFPPFSLYLPFILLSLCVWLCLCIYGLVHISVGAAIIHSALLLSVASFHFFIFTSVHLCQSCISVRFFSFSSSGFSICTHLQSPALHHLVTSTEKFPLFSSSSYLLPVLL